MADGEYGLLALTLTYNKSKPHYMGWNIDTDQLDRGARPQSEKKHVTYPTGSPRQ